MPKGFPLTCPVRLTGARIKAYTFPWAVDMGSIGQVDMGTGRWASLKDAALDLGSTVTALRKRAKRGGLQLTRDNTGRLLVWLDAKSEGSHEDAQPSQADPKPLGMSNLPTVAQHGHPEQQHGLLPLPQVLAMISDAVAQERTEQRRQQDQMRADHAAELARMSSHHLDLIGRIQAQAIAERSLFLERVDAAELRAESAEARAMAVDDKLHHILERHLEHRPISPESTRPWWMSWFGQSKRSDMDG